ncbi:MAG: hypothetical protein VB089_06415 [Anaerolineaceae bacterium]|nr:hypothetical protein [Anaerolineaceae bacterium]
MLLKILAGVFLALHGLVHLLYLAQSRKVFELAPGLTWPDGSWALSKLLGNPGVQTLAAFSLGLTALGFVTGGAGILLEQPWARLAAAAAAVLSTVLFLTFWNGEWKRLDNQGLIGIAINLAILAAVIWLR